MKDTALRSIYNDSSVPNQVVAAGEVWERDEKWIASEDWLNVLKKTYTQTISQFCPNQQSFNVTLTLIRCFYHVFYHHFVLSNNNICALDQLYGVLRWLARKTYTHAPKHVLEQFWGCTSVFTRMTGQSKQQVGDCGLCCVYVRHLWNANQLPCLLMEQFWYDKFCQISMMVWAEKKRKI